MNDISDLAALCVEDLAQADLFDLVSCGSVSSTECGPGDKVGQMSRSPSPASCLEQEESFTSITLINGEQICLREGGGGEEGLGWGGGTGVSDSMDLNSILQAGVVERVAPVSSTSQLDLELDCSRAGLDRTPRTILASQLPGAVSLAGPGVLRRATPSSTLTVIQTAVQSLPATSDTANNNNSLLRSALQGKAGVPARPRPSPRPTGPAQLFLKRLIFQRFLTRPAMSVSSQQSFDPNRRILSLALKLHSRNCYRCCKSI